MASSKDISLETEEIKQVFGNGDENVVLPAMKVMLLSVLVVIKMKIMNN
jgi:hypothetical protein